VSPELSAALRIEGQVKLGLMIAKAALERRESRGSHNREDYPERDDKNGLTRTLAWWKDGADMPELTYEDASMVFELPPGERGYGGGKIIPADPDMVAARTITKGQVINKEQPLKKEQPKRGK
jgi:fumarate reductase flavoprotein subunit